VAIEITISNRNFTITKEFFWTCWFEKYIFFLND
jgi:hypothetical protein